MRRTLFLITTSFCIGKAMPQNNLAFSAGMIQDKNFDIRDATLSRLQLPVVENAYSFFLQTSLSRITRKRMLTSAGLRIAGRKIDYYYDRTPVTGFMHFTMEVPFSIGIKQELNQNLAINYHLGGGVNYVLTPDDRSLVGNLAGTGWERFDFQFIRSKKVAYFLQPVIEAETKISEKCSLKFFIAYQWQLTPTFRYRIFNDWFDFYHSPILTNNFSLGIGYTFL